MTTRPKGAVEVSIDLQGSSPFEVGGLVVRLLQDRYLANIEGYDVSPAGEISVSVGLPEDRWTRRVVIHRAQVDRNAVMLDRARRIHEAAQLHCLASRFFIQDVKAALAQRGACSRF